MTPAVQVGSATYGGGGSQGACLDQNKQEAPLTSATADVSRSTILYFPSSVYLGNTGITGVIESSNINKQALNRSVNFLNDVYTLIGNAIYKYVPESGLFETSLVLTGKDGTRTNSIGLYPVWVNNKSTLITAWNTTGSTWRYAKLDDTGQWTVGPTSSVVNPSDANGGILHEIQHEKKIYFVDSGTTTIYWFDYQDERFGSTSWSSTVRHPMDFCVFGNDLYALNKDASSNINIHRIDGTSTTNVATYNRTVQSGFSDINSALTTTNNFEGRALLFVDNVFDTGNPVMHSFYMAHGVGNEANIPGPETDHGISTLSFTHNADGTLTNIDAIHPGLAIAFPANPWKMMQNQTGGEEFRFGDPVRKDEGLVLRCFVDQKNRELDLSDSTNIGCMARMSMGGCTPGEGGGGDFTNLQYFGHEGSGVIIRSDNQPASFRWDGFPAKQSRHRAFAHEKIGGGARYWELNGGNRLANIEFRGLENTPANGVVRIKYRLTTTADAPSGTNVSVRWFYDRNLHAPESFCTLVSTSDGSLSGNFIATSIPLADKEYFVDWDAKADGAPRNQLTYLNGQVATALSAVTAITDPTDLTGLTLWLEANDQTTITSGVNGEVSDWRDKSGAAIISGVSQTGIARPTWIENANNGLAGIEFISSSGHYMFESGSPITGDPMTTIVIYEPSSLTGRQNIASFANDNPFVPISGVIWTDVNHYSIFASGDGQAIVVKPNGTGILSTRELGIASGARPNAAKVAIWREVEFQSLLQFAPSGDEVEIFDTSGDLPSPSGLSNTTIGRFSGSFISGIYPSAGENFDGTVYEVAVYNRQLFDLEVERFILYAQNKYTLLL
jgi:hypothetical protein